MNAVAQAEHADVQTWLRFNNQHYCVMDRLSDLVSFVLAVFTSISGEAGGGKSAMRGTWYVAMELGMPCAVTVTAHDVRTCKRGTDRATPTLLFLGVTCCMFADRAECTMTGHPRKLQFAENPEGAGAYCTVPDGDAAYIPAFTLGCRGCRFQGTDSHKFWCHCIGTLLVARCLPLTVRSVVTVDTTIGAAPH
jgi:hypothetical protein